MTPAQSARVVWRRRLAKYSRWLHIYLSMFSCAVVLFFAVTGVTLNHTEWFAGAERVSQANGALNTAWTNTGAGEVAKLEIVEALRQAHRLSGAVTDFRVDDQQVAVSFKGPGYAADAFIERADGKYELTETRQGLVAIVNDLHKGRDSGAVWKALIDASAIFLSLVALTGLVLLYFVHKHRVAGFILLGFGLAVVYGGYLAFVP